MVSVQKELREILDELRAQQWRVEDVGRHHEPSTDTTRQWAVTLDYTVDVDRDDPAAVEDLAVVLADALDDLRPEAAAVAASDVDDRLSVVLTLDSGTDRGGHPPLGAAGEADGLVRSAAVKAGLGERLRTVRVTVADYAFVDAENDAPAHPALVGVTEVAGLLGVSRQRVTQLDRDLDDFPRPLARLAAGPVWVAAEVRAFEHRWARRPGRPSAAPTGRRGGDGGPVGTA